MAEICYRPNMLRDLANRWFQPLTHVSGGGFPRVSKPYVNRGTRDTRHSKRFTVAHRVARSVLAPFRPLTLSAVTTQTEVEMV
jgi:hypothetical protein